MNFADKPSHHDRYSGATSLDKGCRVNRYKPIVFVLSVTFSGLAGASKYRVFQLASLTEVHWFMSGEAVLLTLLAALEP